MKSYEILLAGSPFEKILGLMLEGEDDNLAILRCQVSETEKVAVRDTGAGFFVDFPKISDSNRVADDFPNPFGDVHGYLPGTDEVIFGSLLFLDNGAISMLEIYDFVGDLTIPLEELEFRHSPSQRQ